MQDNRRDLRRRSHLLRTACSTILVGLLAVFVLEAAVALRAASPAIAAALQLVFRMPMLIFLWTIWMVRRVFGKIAEGALFDQIVPALLRRVGLSLAAGGIASVLVAPLLLHLLRPAQWSAIGSFDPAAITLAIIGLLLTIVSRLLAEARVVSDELDGII